MQIQNLTDDLSNRFVGHSFLKDLRNSSLPEDDALFKAILDSPQGRDKFLIQSPTGTTWNHHTLHQWLKDYAELEGLLLLRAEMLGGAPGRGTEMTSMTYCNIPTRPFRNLVLVDEYVVLLRRYHKSGALTGVDKLIPHALDAFTGSIIIQDLALLRPMAQIIAHILYPDNSAITTLYQTKLFVNKTKEFTTEQLSDSMAKHSLSFLGFALTLAAWRHISIAFRRKFCAAVMEFMENDEPRETIEALQAGHHKAIEDRIYGLSADSLAGLAEDFLIHFLKASCKWQQTCLTVPG